MTVLAPTEPSKELSHEDLDPSNIGQLKEILRGYEARLFEARTLNKNLEFRNYML